MATEIHYDAALIGQASPARRLDPPLLMGLDEVTQICPVPLPSWLSDSGGKGIQVIAVVHGEAQLAGRWGDHGRQVVLDTSSVKVFLPGITDTTTLEAASMLCGQAPWKVRGQDHATRHDVATPDMIRQLPAGFALVIRGGCAPVIARLPRAWRNRAYRRARRHAPAPRPCPGLGRPRPPIPTPAGLIPGWTTTALPRGAGHDRRPAHRDPRPARRPRRAAHPARRPRRRPARHAGRATVGQALRDDTGVLARIEALEHTVAELRRPTAASPRTRPDRSPAATSPARRGLVEADRRRPAGAARPAAGWVDQVYRPGYGHLAATLGPCWAAHDLCLYGLDILAALWSVLYLQPAAPPACCPPRPNTRPASCPPWPPSWPPRPPAAATPRIPAPLPEHAMTDATLRRALAYAARGWPVFPCQPGHKIPATAHGYLDATTDPEQITAWFTRHPGRNLAIATGAPGPDVLDVDQHGPPATGTPPSASSATPGCSTAPPPTSAPPAAACTPTSPAPPSAAATCPAMPPRLPVRRRLRPGPAVAGRRPSLPGPGHHRPGRSPGLGRRHRPAAPSAPARLPQPRQGQAPGRDLDHLARWVAAQPEGNRNAGLFWAANRALETDPAADLSPLAAAARQAGLPDAEITRTLDSARRTSQPHPRQPDHQAEGN